MIDLNIFDNPFENFYVLKKWNWDYLEAEAFQLKCVEYIRDNPRVSILIFCSHPHVFTLGRGLQKTKDPQIQLVDYNYNPDSSLPFPLHLIKRGGGLTFHYPGQFVFYPIVNLNHFDLGVFDLMMEILKIVKATIEKQFHLQGLNCRKDLLGLWFENEFSKAKLASIGLAANRFITYHGLALNFFNDELMFSELRNFYPCGLPGDIYRSLETLNCGKIDFQEREHFVSSFLSEFYYLMTERHKSSLAISDSISF